MVFKSQNMPIGFFKLPFQYLTSSDSSVKAYWDYDSCFIIDDKAANVVKRPRKYQTGHRIPIGGQR